MIKTSCGKKQYVMLLIISLVLSVLIPMIGYQIEIKYITNYPLINIISTVVNVFGIVGTSILVFISFRYKFKYCLPFAFFPVILYIYDLICLSLYNKSFLDSSYLLSFIVNNVLLCIAPFAIVGISKLSAKHTKKEISAVIITFIAILVLNLVIYILYDITRYIQDTVFLKENYIFTLKSYFTMILYHLCKCILMFAVYYIIKFAFSDNKKEICSKFSSNVKKLWAKTAE